MKKWSLIISAVFVSAISSSFFSQADEKSVMAEPVAIERPAEYEISVNALTVSAYSVDMVIRTNIPLPVEVMASISIKDQKPTDTYIGVSKRVKLTQSEQTVTLNGESENLPAGEYIAEVTFYPRWGAAEGSKKAKEIEEEIIGTADVRLAGSGESKDQADRRNAAQIWVMENVIVGTPWDETKFVDKLGGFSKSEADLNLHNAYYFPEADMTIIVNTFKSTVTTWRIGQASK